VAWTTLPDAKAAATLGRHLVQAGLAACAQVDGPLLSIYRWNGAVEEAAEHRLTLKILPERLAAAEQALLAHHPYDTPQWVVVAADAGEKYLNWARSGA
jgi:periplasmic divalent cation tolerance protein